MRVGILGSGCMGGKLGTLFTRAEHDVVFSYAREASEGADALLLAVQGPPLTLRFANYHCVALDRLAQ